MPRTPALLALAALAACSEPLPAPRVERVALEAAPEPADARKDMLRERAGVERVLSDARDAWTLPIGARAQAEVPWPAQHTGTFETAACAVRLPGAPSAGRVRLEVRPAGGSRPWWSAEFDLADSAPRWRPVRHAVEAGGPLRVEFAAEWVGDPPSGAEKVRAAFELPAPARGQPAPPAGAPNVLVITVDSLRADRLGSYGNPRKLTPNLDALAARGARFANAYSSAPWTLPSYGSLFTALYPGEHRAGVVTEREELFGQDVDSSSKRTEGLRPDVPTLAGLFAAHGWSTAMLQNNPYLSRQSGLERGFQRYVGYGSNARNGVDLALAWLEGRSAPWLLVVHLMDPHFPYAPPAPFDERFARTSVEALQDWPPNLDQLRLGKPGGNVAQLSVDLYDGEVAFTDEQVGRLLSGLGERGLTADTIVVFHSDHGEEFWEHGSCDHGHAQHEELLRVPLLLAWPGHVPAVAVAARVRALDVLPTLCRLAGIAPPAAIEGEDLAPMWNGAGGPRRVIAEAVHSGAREIKAVLSQQWKLVARGASERWLYDLSQDRYERQDLAREPGAPADGLRSMLGEHHARSKDAARHARELELDPAALDRAKSIGYAGDGSGGRDGRK